MTGHVIVPDGAAEAQDDAWTNPVQCPYAVLEDGAPSPRFWTGYVCQLAPDHDGEHVEGRGVRWVDALDGSEPRP